MTYLALLVFVGGAAGTLCRFGLSTWITHRAGPQFPWGTLAVNVAGSFLIGLILGWPDGLGRPAATPPVVALLAVGFCGGLTTFSSFSLQTLAMLLERRWAAGAGNVILSTLLCVLAVAGGVGVAHILGKAG
ncbi:MAG TPA: CrcB family protein [Chthoniobacterales bacterium]